MRKHKIIIIVALIGICLAALIFGLVKQQEYKNAIPEYYIYFRQSSGISSTLREYKVYTENTQYYITVTDVKKHKELGTYELTEEQFLKCIPSYAELKETSEDEELLVSGCGSDHFMATIKYQGKKEICFDYKNRCKAGDLGRRIYDVLNTIEEYKSQA